VREVGNPADSRAAVRIGEQERRPELQSHCTKPKVRRSSYEVPIAAVHLMQPGFCGARQVQRVGGSQEDARRQRGHAARLCLDERGGHGQRSPQPGIEVGFDLRRELSKLALSRCSRFGSSWRSLPP